MSRLIQVYANRGHLIANLDPLGLQERAKPYVLDLEYFGLSDADLDTEFFTGSRNEAIPERAKLKNILARPEVHLHRHHRRGICARVGHRRAAVAAGQFPGRAHAAPLQRR